MDEIYISQWDALQCFEDWEDAHGNLYYAHEDRIYKRIEALSPADVVPAPQWISVNERLPDKEEKYYLCYAKGGYPCLCLWTDDIFGLRNVYINSEKKFGGEWGWSVHTKPRYDTITHWMPLPEPPEEVKENG